MTIPGSNLLASALRVIAAQSVEWSVNTGRTVNSIGMEVPAYAPPVTIYGSFQPVPRTMYAELGLDFNKRYARFFSSNDMLNVDRDFSGDKIVFNGITYKCESVTEWFELDGWKEALLIKAPS